MHFIEKFLIQGKSGLLDYPIHLPALTTQLLDGIIKHFKLQRQFGYSSVYSSYVVHIAKCSR